MKTTIEISDPLLREARRLAEREGVTLRALVERGLRRVVTETKPGAPFKLGVGGVPLVTDQSYLRITCACS